MYERKGKSKLLLFLPHDICPSSTAVAFFVQPNIITSEMKSGVSFTTDVSYFGLNLIWLYSPAEFSISAEDKTTFEMCTAIQIEKVSNQSDAIVGFIDDSIPLGRRTKLVASIFVFVSVSAKRFGRS